MSSIDPVKVRAARRAVGLTQAQLAEKAGAGLTRYLISDLELGRAMDLSEVEQRALAEALGVALQELELDEGAKASILTLNPSRLRLARKAAKLTQPQLAAKSGFGQSTISRLEAGTTGISLEGVQNLATALGVSVKYLLGETENHSTPEEDVLTRIRERYDIPPGLRELATTENLLAELAIQADEWQALASLAQHWQRANLTPRNGWVQILLALRTASTLHPADPISNRVR